MRTPTRPLRAVAVAAVPRRRARRVRQLREQRQQHQQHDCDDLGRIDGDRRVARWCSAGRPSARPARTARSGSRRPTGLHFKSFKPLDAGGPLTVAALDRRLDPDRPAVHDQRRRSRPTAGCCSRTTRTSSPPTTSRRCSTTRSRPRTASRSPIFVNSMSAKITTEVLTSLNKQTDVDQKDPDDVAKAWLAVERLRCPTSKPWPRPARRSWSAPRTSPRTRRWPTSTPTRSRPTATR